VRGGVYLAGRHGVSVVLKMIGVLIITRVLGPTNYGAYVAASGIYQYAFLLGQAGISVYLLRHQGEPAPLVWRTAYTILLALGTALWLALEASTGLLASWTGVEGAADVMTVMACALPFTLTAIPATVRLERALDYRNVAMVEIFGQLGFYIIGTPLALLGYGPVSLAAAWLTQEILVCCLAHYLSRTRPHFGMDRTCARQIIRYAVNFSAANWVWQMRTLVNPLIVAPALGATAVGLIGLTVGILEMLSIVKLVAWRLSLVVLGQVQDDYAKLRKGVTEGMEMQTLVVGATLLGFGWFGGWVVPLVFGARWAPMMQYYPYVALGYLTVAMFNVHSALLSVIDRNRDLAIFSFVHILLFATTAWFAVRAVGPVGYGYGELAALPSYLVLHLLVARRIGAPRYGLTILWWAAAAVGLFWRPLGPWAIAVPFVALALPPSARRIRSYVDMVFRKRGKAAPVAEAA
jgi:O-antigen/teichoic acid export membrane protein